MFILDEYSNTWNYTFIVVAILAIGIGAFLEYRKMKKDQLKDRRDKRNNKSQWDLFYFSIKRGEYNNYLFLKNLT